MLQVNSLLGRGFTLKIKPYFLKKIERFEAQPANSDSGELFRMKLFVFIDGL